jgi:hypothetical protein
VKTPGRGYHHMLMVLSDATGQILTALPPDTARALANTFVRYSNPYQAP